MKVKAKITALFAALVLLLCALCSIGTVTARADDDEDYYGFPAPTPPEELNPDPSLTSLYYFSDYAGSMQYYYNGFIQQFVNQSPYIQSSEYHLWNNSNTTGGFRKGLEDYLLLPTTDIKNALIIFEVRSSLDWELGVFNGTETDSEIEYRYDGSLYQYMENLFSQWKEDGCKIAFICETDEVWFENNYDMFLDYVDIHINLDMITTFMYSLVKEMQEKHWEESTVIFDDYFSQSWYFMDRFYPYLLYVANDEPEGPWSCPHWREIQEKLNEFGITVYFYMSSGQFTDMYGNDVETEDVTDTVIYSHNVFFIGDIGMQDDEGFNSLREMNPDNVFFAFNLFQRSVPSIGDGTMYCGFSAANLYYYLAVIMQDFILNDYDSLVKFDNWDGRCMVTFKPVYGRNGWLRKPKAFTLPVD